MKNKSDRVQNYVRNQYSCIMMWNATNETEKNYVHHWDVKNDFAYVLQFFSLISDSPGGVNAYFY